MLLLALMLAAPDRVVIVAKKAEKPGFFHKLAGAAGKAVHRLYEKEDPDVARGNALSAQNEPEAALREYDKARERLPDSPRLSLDRSSALLKLGADRAAEAAGQADQALAGGDAAAKPWAAFNLGVAQEALGKPDQAIRAYGTALSLDPQDRDAKVNLELLLNQEERKQKQQVGQPQDNKQKQQGDQQKPDKAMGEEEKKKEEKQAGDQKEEKKDEQPQKQDKADQKKEQKAQAEEKPVDRSEAERLLDALRAGEKNLQAWRFTKDKRKEARRSEPEKDW